MSHCAGCTSLNCIHWETCTRLSREMLDILGEPRLEEPQESSIMKLPDTQDETRIP